ncbi:TlpA family protein disulfide reductase [Alkalihalobacillus pseudalcaliphilus]|uniref:TlpA family protein disulfide reductase n=1 Tax=Alkalihalobacillus pseudalcaliphilus TaxID=79884 RepID=UPI00064DDBDE|nr:TlpA disulfide reductase family protein [Alkalihalobacillus pseudalcaliphilus]KMK76095.1 thioredoxin [Alkalihalobacillus pseudalcaliphilus]
MKKGITISVLLLALIGGAIVFYLTERTEVGAYEGNQAIDFTLPMYKDDTRSLSDFFGEVIILNVWASWCEPCIREMPDLMEIDDEYDDVTVLTVNMNRFERNDDDAPNFIEEIGFTLPVFIDVDGEMYEQYHITGFPRTYIIDQEGIIQQIFPGEINKEMLKNAIEPYIH